MYLLEKMAEYYQEKYLVEAEVVRQADQLTASSQGFRSGLAARIGDFLITCGLRLKKQYPRVGHKVYSSQN